MAGEFGFCPNCGTPRLSVQQAFCAGCGSRLSQAAAPPPQVAAVPPPVTAAPPVTAPPSPAPAGAPPAAAMWPSVSPAQTPPPPGQPASPWDAIPTSAAPEPGAPGVLAAPDAAAQPKPMKLPPVAVLAGIAALVVIALVGFMLINGSKSGGIIFRPSTVSCSRPPAEFAWTIKLPASVKAGDKLTMWVDNESTSMPLTMFKQHADGSWIWEFSSSNTTQNCTSKGSTPGKHTMQIRDASGKVLAEGTLEVTP